MKYVVTMPVETKVAMVIEADTEEQAADEAERLAKADQGEFLFEYLDPREFIEFSVCPTVDEITDAAELGYENSRPANRP